MPPVAEEFFREKKGVTPSCAYRSRCHALREAVHLREANERLVAAAMTAEEVNSRAAEARSAQLKFIAMVAHELRNPLGPIQMAIELLQHVRDRSMLAELHSTIARQTAHMARLVGDLLDASRASTGKFRLDRSIIDLTTVLEAAVETRRPAIADRRQTLTVRLPPPPISVNGDTVRLTQVFSNLLDNASKYTPEGGQIVLSVAARLECWVIVVADNGIGITPDVLPTIFGLFVQDPRAVAIHHGGLGIGLAVVRELVTAHGGTVEARSAGKDLGSELIVTLSNLGAP